MARAVSRPRSRWRFDPRAAACAVVLFALLALLATAGAHWGWVRSVGGDVLAVAWVYCLFKTVWRAPVLTRALAAFCVGVLVEFGQWLAAAQHWHISNRALRIVLGSTADLWDVLAYAIGFGLVLAVEGALRARRQRCAGVSAGASVGSA